MNKIYIVNGEKFDVHETNEQQFLAKYPDAQLFEGPLTEEESAELGKEESILPSASVEEAQALDTESNLDVFSLDSQEITLEEKRKMPYGVAQKLIRQNDFSRGAYNKAFEEYNRPTKGKSLVGAVKSVPLELTKGYNEFKNMLTFGALAAIEGDLSKEEKVALKEAVKYAPLPSGLAPNITGEMADKVNNTLKELDENRVKIETNSFSEAFEKGNYSDAAFLLTEGLIKSSPSIVGAFLGPGAMIAYGTTVAGNKFDEEFEANPDESSLKLIGNAMATGALQVGSDYAFGKILKAAGVIKSKGSAEEAAKFLNNSLGKVAKSLTIASGGEGATEVVQEVLQKSLDNITLDKPVDFSRLKYDLIDNFVLGAVMGGGIATVSSMATDTDAAREYAEHLLMPDQLKQKIGDAGNAINEINKKIESTEDLDIQDEYFKKIEAIENDLISSKAAYITSLNSMTDAEVKTYAKNIDSVSKLKNNPDFKDAIDSLNKDNLDILGNAAERALEENINKTLKAASEADIEVKVFDTTEELNAFAKETGRDSITKENPDGTIIQNKQTGKQTILIDKEQSFKERSVTVGSHELLHGILYNTVKNNPEASIKLGKSLFNELAKIDIDKLTDSDFVRRLKLYNNMSVENQAEEMLTLFSDAVARGHLVYTENAFDKAGNSFRRMLQNFGLKEVKFDTGKDVYNFIKDYNKSFDKGVFKGAIKKGFDSAFAGQLVKRFNDVASKEVQEELQKFSKSGDLFAQTEEALGITKDENGNTTWEGFDENKAILAGYLWTNDVNRRIQKYKNFANFNQYKDDIISDVTIGDVKGARGIVDIIRRWNPDKEPNIAKWINGQIENKILGVAQKYGVGKDFQLDVTESKGLSATETATEIVEQKETKAEADTEVKSLRKEIGLPDELVATVKQAVVKTFGTKLPNIQDPKFRLELQKRFRTELKKPIAKFVGTRANYENFLRDNFEAIYAKLPQSLLNKRFDEFIEPVLDENGKQLREKTAEGNKIFTKKKISKAEFIKYFLGAELGSSTKGARKTTIVEAIAEEMAFDATMEVLSDPDIAQKYQDIAELTDQPLPENFKALVAKQVDRAEDFKFSKSFSQVAEQEYNLLPQELSEVLKDFNTKALQKDYTLLYDNLVAKYNPESIKFSLNTKAEGQWELSPMAEPDRFRNIYRFEVGDVGYDILTDKPEGISFEAFEDEVGLEQDAILQDRNSFGMMFLERKSGSTKTTGAGLQGLTNQFKVFGTVANATIDLIKRENLNSITFTAQGDSRTRLYNSLSQKFAKELGWDIYNWKDEDGVNIFIAYNPAAFDIEPEVPVENPVDIKFSISATANDILNETDAWINFSNDHYEKSKILQEYVGDVVKTGGAQRPSFLINPTIVPGYKELSSDKKRIIDDKINKHRDRIINYKTKNKSSVRPEKLFYKAPHKAYGGTPSEFINNILNGKTYELSEGYSKVYTDMWGKYFDILADHPEMYDFLETTLQTSNNEVAHWHRLGAKMGGYDPTAEPVLVKRKNKYTGKESIFKKYFEYEHALQNHIVWKNLLETAKKLSKDKNNKQKFLDGVAKVKEDYFMLAISDADARKIDKAGYAHKMPKDWKRFFDRYFNPKVAKYGKGIDPNKLKAIEYNLESKQAVSDKTFAQAYGIKNAKGDKVNETIKLSKSLSSQLNTFIEEKTGIDKRTKISEKRAAMIGEGKGRFKFFLPPNAEDFMGLLYTTLLPGKRGEEQIAFYKEQLVDPFARGIRNYQSAKEQTIRELKALKKAIKKVPTKLASKNETGFTNEVAVRVYLWNKNGYEVPGLKKKEVKDLVRVVANNSDLREFALNINAITRGNGYPEAENNWEAGTITTDLLEMLNTTTRKESLAEFINNKDQIFSKDNLNKLQAAFGKDYRFALEDALGRMVSGRKRYTGIDKDSKKFLDWLNGAVGTIMFWNSRSAILQMLSVVNYTNFSDNNVFNQVKTFANQKQYWTDWHTLMFSDFLKQRRAGSQLDVNINDIIEAAEGSTNPGKAIFAKLIRLGYAPTQIADSFAISTGGAAFYRNRINKYKKEGLSDQEAQDKAFLDFQEITEETQQSSRDDRISQIQAGGLGRVIFAFANTPMQYARIIKRSSQDLINGRGDWKQNISRIAFYGFLQNIIFSTLQSGLFALLIDNEDDDEVIEDRALRALNSTADSLLRGSGLPGAVLATVKNAAFEVFAELKKDRPKVWKAGLTGATSISPPINSKVRKVVGALDRLSYKSTREDIMTKGLSLENPVFDIGGKLTSAITNAPADRLLRKTENIMAAMDEQTSTTQALFLTAGWSKYDLNMIEKRPQKLKITRGSGASRRRVKQRKVKKK